MISLTQYQVDAFTPQAFRGNPAAVIVLDNFLGDKVMQAIAMENNLSETAFVVPKPDRSGHYDLRWFTPTVEIEFCGHATIASAHVLSAELRAPVSPSGDYVFSAMIGELRVRAQGTDYALTAPKTSYKIVPISLAMRAAFPVELETAFTAGNNLYVIAKHAHDVRGFKPDYAAIIPLSDHGVGLSASGGDDGADITSRFFVPAEGIDEDPVTGSAHAELGPFWADTLGTSKLKAYQASPRGGWLDLNIGQTHVVISGPAVTFSKGQIFIPDH